MRAAGVCRRGGAGGEQVLNGEKLLWADHGDDALMGRGFGEGGQLIARFLADAHAAFAA